MGNAAVTLGSIEKTIQKMRGHRVMLDEDLAKLYGVPTKSLNLAVKRNLKRFPLDFRFQLTAEEATGLRFQIETSNKRGGRRYLPWVFTQEGVAMLSGVLSSPRAVAVNVEIMRAFVRMRSLILANAEVMRRLKVIEAEAAKQAAVLGEHTTKTNHALKVVFEALRKLADQLSETGEPMDPIGFKTR